MILFKNEYDSRIDLEKYELPMGKFKLATNEEDIVDILEEITFPVVMKIVSDQIVHKTEAGGVKLNIKTLEEGVKAFKDLNINAKNYDPNAEIKGVLISSMIPSGVEVIIGATRDKQFGPVIMFGLGGIFVEIFKDVEFRMAPLTKKEALDLINSIKSSSILNGARGMKPVNKEMLADLIVKLGNYIVDNPEVMEVDLNPVICFDNKVEALDASIGFEIQNSNEEIMNN